MITEEVDKAIKMITGWWKHNESCRDIFKNTVVLYAKGDIDTEEAIGIMRNCDKRTYISGIGVYILDDRIYYRYDGQSGFHKRK